jgi:hypothetical protein
VDAAPVATPVGAALDADELTSPTDVIAPMANSEISNTTGGDGVLAAAQDAPNAAPILLDAHSDTALAQALKAEELADSEVEELSRVAQWAWVELNYRHHAYQGRACVVHVRRGARRPGEFVVCTFIIGPASGSVAHHDDPVVCPEVPEASKPLASSE